MAINIKIYRNDSLDEFTKEFCAEEKLETGSFNAMTAAMAAALFERAAKIAGSGERRDYMERNAEILRTYFIHLTDDDVKARAGYCKELKTGDECSIEAAIHPAVSVNEEIIGMCMQMLELGVELKEMLPSENWHYLVEMAELALGAVKSSISWILAITGRCSDDTYKYVVKRENELNLEEVMKFYNAITAS